MSRLLSSEKSRVGLEVNEVVWSAARWCCKLPDSKSGTRVNWSKMIRRSLLLEQIQPSRVAVMIWRRRARSK